MRGDFLGEAMLTREDLEIGRELDLTLKERGGVHGENVQGSIKLVVGEPEAKAAQKEQRGAVDATATTEQVTGTASVKKEVGVPHQFTEGREAKIT